MSASYRKAVPFERGLTTLYGPYKAGKTVCAATISKDWPGDWKRQAKEVHLTDMVWVPFDGDECLVGLQQINVVPLSIDVQGIFGDYSKIPEGLKKLQDEIYAETKKVYEKAGHCFLVLDTFSTWDGRLTAWWEENCPKTAGGNKDTRSMWVNIAAMQTRFMTKLLSLPISIIALMHSKPRSKGLEKDETRELQENKAKATIIGDDELIPATSTVKTLEIFQGLGSALYVVECKAEKGKPQNQWKRIIHTTGWSGFTANNRYQDFLGDVEPADLGKIRAKILKGLGGK